MNRVQKAIAALAIVNAARVSHRKGRHFNHFLYQALRACKCRLPSALVKLLLARSFIAFTGAALLAAAHIFDRREALWAALALLVLAEVLALAGLRTRCEGAGTRALLGMSESVCGIGVSLIEPAAILVALALVVHSVVASGIATVSLSLGKPLAEPRGEFMRRLLSIAANSGLCVIVLQATGAVDSRKALELGARDLALLCMALVIIGSSRALADLALNARWTK